jgi:hypothetical protein
MDVILDSNSYVGVLKNQGPGFLSSNAFVELFAYLRRTNSKLIIPDTVFQEVMKQYQDLLAGSIRTTINSWRTLRRDSMEGIGPIETPDAEIQQVLFKRRLLHPTKYVESKVLDDYSPVPIKEVSDRGVLRIKPASESGEELRDVIIWFLSLDYAKKRGEPVAFVSSDKAFKAPDGTLHPQLITDLKNHGIELLHFHPEIQDFIKNTSLHESGVLVDELGSMITKERIEQLFVSDFESSRENRAFELDANFDIQKRQFIDGKKYEVAPDSFYVEAHYSAMIRFGTIAFSPPPSLGFINAPVAMGPAINNALLTPTPTAFSRIGSTVSLADLVGYPRLKVYEGVFDLELSFRLVAGQSESLELDDYRVGDLNLIYDHAVKTSKSSG